MDTASGDAAGREGQAVEQWTILPGTTIGGEVGTFALASDAKHHRLIRAELTLERRLNPWG